TPPKRSPIGRNFAWRSYFNGHANDEAEGWHPAPDERLRDTHLSSVFLSSATNTWKVAISAPIMRDDKFLGVVALTVEMGGFMEEFDNTQSRYAVLVDARPGPYQGVILQHPLYDDLLKQDGKLPDRFSDYRVPLRWQNGDQTEFVARYLDPLGKDPAGAAYAQPWIMAKSPVRMRTSAANEPGEATFAPTGWVVLVQENYEAALAPVHNLGGRLVREGLTALAAVFVTICALWFFVVRGFSAESSPTPARRPVGSSESINGSDKSTLPAGER
ncbi:MAG: hypothetical protein KDA41_19195, partial [Planctomycetales bacterium]|nr:hypothetical protein [Planctomycetales bacterium]